MTTSRPEHLAAVAAVERYGLTPDGPTVWMRGNPYRFSHIDPWCGIVFEGCYVSQFEVVDPGAVKDLMCVSRDNRWTTLGGALEQIKAGG